MLAARDVPPVDALAGQVAPGARGHRHWPPLLARGLRSSSAETPPGRRPAGAAGERAQRRGATRIRPLPGRPARVPTPLPASPSVGLPGFGPVLRLERDGLTPFPKGATDGGGARSAPGA